jgi:hypothetical protein
MRAQLSILALILATSAAACMAQARGTAAARPAVAYSTDGLLYLATETGQVVQTIEAELPIGDFAISPDLKMVVFAPPHPGKIGAPLFILDVASGAIEAMDPDPYFNDDSVSELAEFYSDPEFSPDGTQVVFATHAFGEGSEVQMSGPLAVLDLAMHKVNILRSTVGANGLPLGLIREPHWSPDGKQILGNIEGHVFVTDAGGQVLSEVFIPASELGQSADSYGVYAIGWLGPGCVLYQAGEAPQRDPARVLRMSTQGTSPAATMLRLPEESLFGLRGLSGRLRLIADPEGFRAESPAGNWTIRGDAETTFARLLPQRDAGLVPPDCR